MKVLVFGSRTWRGEGAIRSDLALFPAGTVVVTGECETGADAIAKAAALALGLEHRGYPVVQAVDGPWPAAGPRRNSRMLRSEHLATEPVDFALGYRYGPKSNGTDDMARKCRREGIDTTVLLVK